MSAPSDDLSGFLPDRELRLHFSCSSCHHAMHIPLHGVGGTHACPQCATKQNIPQLDADVIGYHAFVNGQPQTSVPDLRLPCPGCRKRLRLPYDRLNKAFHCPQCRLPLRVEVVARNGTPSQQPSPQSAPSQPVPAPSASVPSPQAATEEPTPPPAAIPLTAAELNGTAAAAPPDPQPTTSPQAEDDEQDEEEDDDPRPRWRRLLYPEPMERSPKPRSGVWYVRAKWKRLAIYFILLLSLPICYFFLTLSSAASERNGLVLTMNCCSCCWIVSVHLPCWWLSGWLTPFIVTTLPCRRCGFEVNPVSIWTVGGYTDYRERHVLRVRSPLTGDRVGWTNCPQCGTTILI